MLTAEQVAQYKSQGFTVYPGLLSPEELDVLLHDLETICAGNTLAEHDATRLEMEPNQEKDGTLVRRVYHPCTLYPNFQELSDSNKLLDCLEQLIGPDILIHNSRVNMKPPSIGSGVEWHQDFPFQPFTNRNSLTVLIYFDDAENENGCLQVLPGRHMEQPMNHTSDGYFQGFITDPVEESQALAVEGQAGTAIFLHSLTPHSSKSNTSDRPRRTLIAGYRAADAFLIYSGEGDPSALDKNTRLVRGRKSNVARCTETEFAIPRMRQKANSIYELQELSRQTAS